jgi:class 3 adenylate cyclase
VDAPDCSYTTTLDGARIAYWTIGSEPPLLLHLSDVPTPSFATMLREPTYGPYFEALRGAGSLASFDFRGVRLSQRVTPAGIEDFLADLSAVVELHGSTDVVLVGAGIGTLIAAEFAARNPDCISHLVLFAPQFSGTALDPALTDMFDLVRRNYSLGIESFWQMVVQWGSESDVRAFARQAVRDIPQESFMAYLDAVRDSDLSQLLPQVTKPKLILAPADHTVTRLQTAQDAAHLASDTRFHVLQGDVRISADYGRELRSVILDFIGLPADGASVHRDDGTTLRTIMFTDLAASTATTQRLGDAAAQDLVRAHNEIVRTALAAHDGHEIKHTGDGIMAWFPAASNGLECAQTIQRGVSDLANPDLGVKIGLNAGEPIAEEDDLYGTAVQIAARVTDQAGAGEIVCTNVVRELVAGKAYLFSEREPASLKGVEEPVRLFNVSQAVR